MPAAPSPKHPLPSSLDEVLDLFDGFEVHTVEAWPLQSPLPCTRGLDPESRACPGGRPARAPALVLHMLCRVHLAGRPSRARAQELSGAELPEVEHHQCRAQRKQSAVRRSVLSAPQDLAEVSSRTEKARAELLGAFSGMDGRAYPFKLSAAFHEPPGKPSSSAWNWGWGDRRALVFPYFRAGQPQASEHRVTATKSFWCWPTAPRFLFNLDALKPRGVSFLVEGELDALSFAAVGVDAVVSLPSGARTATRDVLQPLQIQARVYVATDDDAEGERAAASVTSIIGATRCHRLTFPRFKDANAALTSLGLTKFRRLVEKRAAL